MRFSEEDGRISAQKLVPEAEPLKQDSLKGREDPIRIRILSLPYHMLIGIKRVEVVQEIRRY